MLKWRECGTSESLAREGSQDDAKERSMGKARRVRGKRDGTRAEWVSAGKTGRRGRIGVARDKPGRCGPAGSGLANWAMQAGRVGAG